jgi:transposase
MKKGAPWLKTTLVQCAWAASRTKQNYPRTLYLRLRSRRGAKTKLVLLLLNRLQTLGFDIQITPVEA